MTLWMVLCNLLALNFLVESLFLFIFIYFCRPVLSTKLSECTYYNQDISCCSVDTEKAIISVVKDTQVRIKDIKKDLSNGQREALIRGRTLALTERLAEKNYADATELNSVDESFKLLLDGAAELQDLVSKTYLDELFFDCLTELMFASQDLGCSLCSPSVGEFSSNPGYLFLEPTFCSAAYDKCHAGFDALRQKRIDVNSLFRDVRLAAKRARGEDYEPPIETAATNTTLEEVPLEDMTPSERRQLIKDNIVLNAKADAYYIALDDPLSLPHAAILKDDSYGDDTAENFCRHYFGNISPLHLVTLLELEKSFAVDAVLLGEQEAYSASNSNDANYIKVKQILKATGQGSSSFIQTSSSNALHQRSGRFADLYSAVKSNRFEKRLLEQISGFKAFSNIENSIKQRNYRASVSASGDVTTTNTTTTNSTTTTTTAASSSTNVPDVSAESASNSTSNSTTVSSEDFGLDSSYGLLYQISRSLTTDDKTILVSGYRTFLNSLQTLEPSSASSADIINREYYSKNTPHINNQGDPCITTKKEVCYFPMDETPDGTVEQIKSGSYKSASQTCASGEGTYGWCWVGPPITEADVIAGKQRSSGSCSEACSYQHVVFYNAPIEVNIKTPAGYTLDVLGDVDETVNDGVSTTDAATAAAAASVTDFETGPQGTALPMGDVFYQTLAGPTILYANSTGVQAVERSNRTLYEAEAVDPVTTTEDSAGFNIGVPVVTFATAGAILVTRM